MTPSDAPDLSEARIAQIAARAATATAGPWHRGIGNEYRQVFNAQGGLIAERAGAHDGEFIAHARVDVPALLSALHSANARAKGLRAALEKFTAHYPSGINPYLDEAYADARAALKEMPDGK